MQTLAYDRAADEVDAHRLLKEMDVKPVIENRRLWKDQSEQMLPGHDGSSNVVYDEAGTLYCYNVINGPPAAGLAYLTRPNADASQSIGVVGAGPMLRRPSRKVGFRSVQQPAKPLPMASACFSARRDHPSSPD